MSYEGIRSIQKANFEYIQEMNGSWYYLDEVLRYSKPYPNEKEAKDGLLTYFEEFSNETKLLSAET
jgi:hypothetical protein